MPIISLNSPNCGTNLQVNSDDAILTCSFCGSNSVMKDAIVYVITSDFPVCRTF